MARGKRNSKGNWDARGNCHNGTGEKGLVYHPSFGAVKCNAGCDYWSILRGEGLPHDHLPSRDNSNKPEQKKSKTKKSKQVAHELFVDVEPCPEPVNGTELLDEIVVLLKRYVDASDAIYHTAALWALFTHAFECFFILPILLLVSPTKRSGKTTLLQVLHAIVARPLATSSISVAALFRGVEAFKPTLLIDEADRFLNDKEELGGIVNSGHTKTTAVVVRVDEKFNVQKFSRFCPNLIVVRQLLTMESWLLLPLLFLV